MRTPFIAGNWKMNKTIAEAVSLARDVSTNMEKGIRADVAVIPPFLAIPAVAEALRGTNIAVGAQDVYFEPSGAFTGEISSAMLSDAGCTFALVGHSERRHVLGESDELIQKKLSALMHANLGGVLCVGELIEEREAEKTETVLTRQIQTALEGLTADHAKYLTVAYEPVWAIGTGKTATTEQAEQAHLFIRERLADRFNARAAEEIRIQYGGSVKPTNAAELLAQPNVDGALVGGASLNPDPFLGIIHASNG